MPTHQSSNENVTKDIYAALNRNDIPGVMKMFDPQIERVEPEGFPNSGTYRGHADITAHFSQARNKWAEGSCEPEQFITLGNKVVVFVHVRVRLKDKTEWNEGHIADGFLFKDGKVLQMKTFIEREKALEWLEIQV